MLFAKMAWDKNTAFMLMNEILMTKLMYLTETYPHIMKQPEAHAILTQLDSTYHGILELLDLVTDKLLERDYSQTSLLTDKEEHAGKIRDILNEIFTETDKPTETKQK